MRGGAVWKLVGLMDPEVAGSNPVPANPSTTTKEYEKMKKIGRS